jgi:outer membrane immunogenic protein
MKKILLGVLLAGTAMSAQAADLAPRPYTKAPEMAPVYDWTGFYLGVNAGFGLGRDRTVHDYGNGFGNSLYLQPLGAVGGGQIGYNWQTNSFLGPIVIGVEADIQAADMSDNRTSILGAPQYSQKLDWFGTVRGRVGLVTGPTLTYFTAGYAYGDANTTVIAPGGPFPFRGTRDGWTWGSGVEAALGGNWTGKIEYLYLDLGNRTDAFAGQTLYSELRENIFRVGLNYRIGGNSTYTPLATANWSGFYLGGNIGTGISRDRVAIDDINAGTSALFNLAPHGFIGGAQAGYNWQSGNIVFGLETDFQGSTMEDNRTSVYYTPDNLSLDFNSKLQWLGTVRGRLGYAVGPSLFYATGGFAYGSVKTAINGVGFSDTRTGWTVGGGIETPFTLLGLFGPNWTATTEYLYVDLGDHSFDLGGSVALTTGAQEHIFRTGLNYHFNTPVVTKY